MIRISTDSTSDLTKELYQKYDVTVLPLYIMLGGKEYTDGLDIDTHLMFELVKEHGELPSTAAAGESEYMEYFGGIQAEHPGCEIIHISISSEFSSSFNSARLAAANMKGIYVVDSRNLSTGVGHVVLEAAERAMAGMAAEQIVDELNKDVIPYVETSFILNSLEYMVKGGRCSMVKALGANLLQLRPCIEVVDGKMKVGKKYRGSFARALKQYISDRLEDVERIRPKRIFVTQSDCQKEIPAMCREEVANKGYFDEILSTTAGCTIACHCGPDCLGILFIRK